jgi:SAM-dependent methyltransferase
VTIRYLPPVPIEGHTSSGQGGPDHPMRIVTRRAAGLDPGGWTDELRNGVGKFFDDLAPEWNSRDSKPRIAVVKDALERGLGAATGRGLAIEVGSGTGTYSPLLADRFERVLAVDLSLEMLKLAPPGPSYRVQGDGSRLPVRDGAAAAVVLVNAFLFPLEVARVLAPGGTVLWVNSSGEHTPIYLSTEELLARLPGEWTCTCSRAGLGTWCVLRQQPGAKS